MYQFVGQTLTMAQYIVSARKYRPDTFESLIGQDNIAKTLKNSILRGQLAHAYLFCGPRGVGKTSTARIFAKTINCLNPGPDMEPCGKCESCLSFAEGRSYCIHELDAASNNGVDDIKALIDQVRIPPQVGKYSVYIIDEVHMLSSAAFNAFLKTLEEPPAYAIFILATTEKHKILPTILSRCQTYDFNRITVDNIVGNLRNIAAKEGISIDDESLHVIAGKADGAMRDALTIFDQTVAFCGKDVKYEDVVRNLNVLDYEYSFSLVDNFLSGDYRSAMLTFDEILSKGFNALHFVASLSSHLRDLIVSKASADALLELPDSLKAKYKAQADRCSLKFLYDALDITMRCESGYRASVNPRLHIEFALMKLSFLTASQTAAAQMAGTQSARPQAVRQPAEAGRAASQPTASAGPAIAGPAPAQTAPVQPVAPQQASPEASPARETAARSQDAPAPAAAEDQPQPRPRKRRAAASESLSLTSMMEEKASEAKPQTSDKSGEMPSDETITGKWPELVAMYASKPRLANTLASSKLAVLTEDDRKILVFNVLNQAQKDWVESKLLHELEGRFRALVGDARVSLRVDLIPEEERPQTVYMPSEKAKDLMSKNDQVRSLVSDFDLDVK